MFTIVLTNFAIYEIEHLNKVIYRTLLKILFILCKYLYKIKNRVE